MYALVLPIFAHGFRQMRNLYKVRFSHTYVLQSSSLCSSTSVPIEPNDKEQEVVIALGSNVGNRIQNLNDALVLMKSSGIRVTRHACLYETEPAYMTDQPLFLNSAVRGFTKLGPHDLLGVLKQIEKELGREKGIRYGPRPIDLDILFYGKFKITSEVLSVPHERIWERPFVVAPLIDLLGTSVDNDCVAAWHSFSGSSGSLFELWNKLGGESLIGRKGMRRVIPIGNQMWDWSNRTQVMGVINVTPDSFSDGGKFQSVENAVSQARLLISDGADIIDIGAQSTRPKAPKVSVNKELDSLLPVLEAVVQMPEIEGRILSVDTFYSEVAVEAVKRGVHIVNDVSGGQLDPAMFGVISDLKVPYVVMHMRGDPSNMQSKENTRYDDVCRDVASELHMRISEAEVWGVPAWRMIIDPGIGFSKQCEQNLEILKGLPNIRKEIGLKSIAASHAPILIGPSRKKFLGEICNRDAPAERDPATVAAVTVGILGGADIVRVHNVRYGADATRLCDALLKKYNV